MHAIVQLVDPCLHALELGRRLVDLLFHQFRVVHELLEVLLRRLRVIQLHFQEKLRAQEVVRRVLMGVSQQIWVSYALLMELLAVDLGPELDHVSEVDCLFRVPDEESLGHESGCAVEDLGLNQLVKRGFVSVFWVAT